MSAKFFLCPDKIQYPITDCLTKCRMYERCLTKPILSIVVRQREWKGIPSTTQLLNGTIMEYLKITHDYSIDPREQAFVLLGVMVHADHESAATKLNLPAEIALDGDRNIIDFLEPDESQAGFWKLWDLKVWGSYRVAKALGISKVEGSKPARFVTNPEQAEHWEEDMQLNRYRILLMGRGVAVSDMTLQVIVRDGDTYMATGRGVTEKFYKIAIPRLDDAEVASYFASKYFRLLESLEGKREPDLCDDRECWQGRRCVDYCDVAEWCPKGQMEKMKANQRGR